MCFPCVTWFRLVEDDVIQLQKTVEDVERIKEETIYLADVLSLWQSKFIFFYPKTNKSRASPPLHTPAFLWMCYCIVSVKEDPLLECWVCTSVCLRFTDQAWRSLLCKCHEWHPTVLLPKILGLFAVHFKTNFFVFMSVFGLFIQYLPSLDVHPFTRNGIIWL